MDKCYFCTDLKAWAQMDKERKNIYAVKLVVYDNGSENSQQYHTLNYCPECGKKIDFDELYNKE